MIWQEKWHLRRKIGVWTPKNDLICIRSPEDTVYITRDSRYWSKNLATPFGQGVVSRNKLEKKKNWINISPTRRVDSIALTATTFGTVGVLDDVTKQANFGFVIFKALRLTGGSILALSIGTKHIFFATVPAQCTLTTSYKTENHMTRVTTQMLTIAIHFRRCNWPFVCQLHYGGMRWRGQHSQRLRPQCGSCCLIATLLTTKWKTVPLSLSARRAVAMVRVAVSKGATSAAAPEQTHGHRVNFVASPVSIVPLTTSCFSARIFVCSTSLVAIPQIFTEHIPIQPAFILFARVAHKLLIDNAHARHRKQTIWAQIILVTAVRSCHLFSFVSATVVFIAVYNLWDLCIHEFVQLRRSGNLQTAFCSNYGFVLLRTNVLDTMANTREPNFVAGDVRIYSLDWPDYIPTGIPDHAPFDNQFPLSQIRSPYWWWASLRIWRLNWLRVRPAMPSSPCSILFCPIAVCQVHLWQQALLLVWRRIGDLSRVVSSSSRRFRRRQDDGTLWLRTDCHHWQTGARLNCARSTTIA